MNPKILKEMGKTASYYVTLGLEMASALMFSTLLGAYLDQHFSTSPWGLFSGLLIGIGAASKLVIAKVSRFKKSLQLPSASTSTAQRPPRPQLPPNPPPA